jgi:hypothetical protein
MTPPAAAAAVANPLHREQDAAGDPVQHGRGTARDLRARLQASTQLLLTMEAVS